MKKQAFFVALACFIALCGASFAQNNQQVQITNGPVVEGTGDTWAVVAWTTNTGSSSVVHYGTDQNNLGQTAQQDYSQGDSQNGANHRVRITNLQPGMTYYFKVDSGQAQGSGSTTSSNVAQFTTKQSGQSSSQNDRQYERQNGRQYERQNGRQSAQGGYQNGRQDVQITDGPRVLRAGDTWAMVGWMTNGGGDSVVHYGTDPNNLSQTAQSQDASDREQGMHRVRITGLQPGMTYYFAVDSGEGRRHGARSNVEQFTTRPQGRH